MKSITLREARKRARLTQEELEQKAGVSQTFISKLEREGGTPSFQIVIRLARAVDVDPLALSFDHVEAAR